MKVAMSLTVLLTLSIAFPTLAEPADRRAAVSQSGANSVIAANVAPAAEPAELASALDFSADLSDSATLELSGNDSAVSVSAGLGVIAPVRGASFVVLSSGVAGSGTPEPGVDLGSEGPAGDRTTLLIDFEAPEGATRLSFSYNFLSSEFPDFIGSEFNDTFTAVLVDSRGTREIARESVNGSSFFPSSASRAGGSGFDIFTDDPEGVDFEFLGGLPEAGLTGFKTVDVEIEPGRPLTLEFSIEDRTDGMLDSAVILDNIVLTSIELIDPFRELLSDGGITTDLSKLATGGNPIRGAATDGVTEILVRSVVPEPGTVEFCLSDGSTAPEDGHFYLLGESDRQECVLSPTRDTSRGPMAFAAYQVPEGIGTDESTLRRDIKFSATFTADDGAAIESEVTFELVRPPVMLLHGLWSSLDVWTFPLAAREFVTIGDYSATNASRFAANARVPQAFIREALTNHRIDGYAATQVDVVGHSMGGILGRNHTSLADYLRNDNFNAGDINRLITLNTPHSGALLPSLLVRIRAIPVLGSLAESAAAAANMPIDLGAIDDLATGSSAIQSIRATPVPGHAVVGTGGSTALSAAPGKLGAFYTLVNFFAPSDLFAGLQHDFLVGRPSQEGGMPDRAITVFGGLNSIHTLVTGSEAHSDTITTLLNADPNGTDFAEFPRPSTLGALERMGTDLFSPLTELKSDGLRIVSPTDGEIVAPGDTVNVIVDVSIDFDLDSVLVVGPEKTAEVDDSSPFEIELVIPEEAIGPFAIFATGKDASGDRFVTSPRVQLLVEPDVALESLALMPTDPLFFAVGDTRALTVIGKYTNGVVRDISAPETRTTYLTSDAGIVAVAEEGEISAVAAGIATIVARNGVFQDSISVRVLRDNVIPVADAGEDRNGVLGELVVLNGSGSFDPDAEPGDELVFEWQQIDGPSAPLSNADTPDPSFTPDTAGTYTFGLVVRDNAADSVPDSVNIIVKNDSAVVAPSIVGTPRPEAESIVTNAGLAVGNVARESSDTVPIGQVIRQKPESGSIVTAGSSVDFVVSTGSDIGTGIVGDRVWLDTDGDGQQEPGELGIEGVTVILRDANGTSIAEQTTQINGRYLFTNLGSRTYVVEILPETLPAGVVPSFDRDGIDSAHRTVATVGAGQSMPTVDFGYTRGRIGDRVWFDSDGDGAQEPGERGIEGVTMELSDTHGNVISSIETQVNGRYQFTNLQPATYVVRVLSNTLPPHLKLSFDSDGIGTANKTTVELLTGEARPTIDFGYAGETTE